MKQSGAFNHNRNNMEIIDDRNKDGSAADVQTHIVSGRNDLPRHKKSFIIPAVLITAILFVSVIMSGCTIKDLSQFFSKEVSSQEETASVAPENELLTAQVNNAEGKALVKTNGEPLTVLAAYDTAEGGEPKINSRGELETYPLGEVMTYQYGEAVTKSDGTQETYAGGEEVTDVLGFTQKDENGNPVTRAAGETVTHGEEEIIYDESGERMTYSGEPLTYAPGDVMYDTNGERVTYPVMTSVSEDGITEIHSIEVVTNASGEPLIESNGEVATRQLDPTPPKQIVEPPFESGQYYINNITSDYVFFSAPEVEAENIALLADEGVNPYDYYGENGTGTVKNLQLEILGENLPYYEVCFDPEGYAYFVLQGTEQVLTLAGNLRNGVNVMPRDIERFPYDQYKYWDEPVYTVADNQKFIISKLPDGSYKIASVIDDKYVMTVDDQFGIQYANVMMWEYDGRDLQKFKFSSDTPKVEQYFEEGNYVISSNLTNWQLISLPDYNYNDGEDIYLYSSYKGEGQLFHVTFDEYGLATFTHGESNMALSVYGATASDGQYVCQYPADGGNWQKWIISPHEHGGYYLRSALNISEVLDLSEGSTVNGNSIKMHWTNKTVAQSWDFKKDQLASPNEFAYMDDYAQYFSSETEYLILVSSGTSHVGVYIGEQGNWNNLYYWNCVAGKESTPTVKGEFSIYAKSQSFDGNMDSPEWYTCYYASMFYPQYFFHSIIYYQGTTNIMDDTMGYNASHGCVRLDTDNAQWIYDNIPLNTKVVSY